MDPAGVRTGSQLHGAREKLKYGRKMGEKTTVQTPKKEVWFEEKMGTCQHPQSTRGEVRQFTHPTGRKRSHALLGAAQPD